ncbi:MAG: carboxylating nicotinate-nucleotide diphosphorylase [Clostridia bacterium]|nr:carboxylating nicotinate-nucleotide diphosphorylase [Clostridia bacterium]
MNKLIAKELIEVFLKEDVGTGDLSTSLVFDEDIRGEGYFLAKDDGIVCGTDIIDLTYSFFSDDYSITLYKKDGDIVKRGEHIAKAEGKASTLLTAERVVLNLMQLMSGIATMGNRLVTALDDSSIKIVDTRKTHPGLRMFEKYAVTCGGCYNHRYALYDGVMLKDNHIAFAGGITKAVNKVKSQLGHMVKVEVETETREQVIEAVNAGADVIMFDNRTPDEIKELQKLVPSHIVTEASGGITLDTIGSFKGCGVNIISAGSLTNGVKPLDISFLSKEAIKK